MVKKAHSSFVRNLKLTISRNDPTLSLSEMCQHKSTIRLVRCYRWRSPLGALNVKNEQEKQEESNTHRQDNLCNFAPMISPPRYWMGTAPRASSQAFVTTSGADLTRAAVPYISQHTQTLEQRGNELLSSKICLRLTRHCRGINVNCVCIYPGRSEMSGWPETF